MKEFRLVNKQVQKKDGTWVDETIQVPLTPEEIAINAIKFKKKELKKHSSYLTSTDWVITKKIELELTKEQLIERHPEIIAKRTEARIKMQVLQKELG